MHTPHCISQKKRVKERKKRKLISCSTITDFYYEYVKGLQNKAIVHIYLIKTS